MSKAQFKVLVIPKRDTTNFLALLPDHLPLSSVLLPGTHDTMALYGWPVSQCQSLSTPLMIQLCAGIRFLDIRLAVIQGRLIAYHGIASQREPFQRILATLSAFLSSPASPSETVVVSIKQEDFRETPPQQFSILVRDEITSSPGGIKMWFLENRIPKLGEVRGKAIMFSRFGGNGDGWEGGRLGIHPSSWPDAEKQGFTWQCKDTVVRTHDWYNISSFLAIPEKVTLGIQNMVLYTESKGESGPLLPITYFSAASFPLAFPTVIARGFGWPEWGLGVEGVNRRLGKWLLEQLVSEEQGREIRGWTLVDFYSEPESEGLVPVLVECNFV
ncbi:hypothetical protein M378DRAFT_71215 [Amanita muscaria Koide BX008]|uniref:Phosphatidylinositol-specific phospholipase C X domain-containing protein n=1 Tax=Amanita muscaria (strain Koide BX008) TaxID=946122 RepID=A0A0C2X331_AMAMK|nr:hypothetical protein M378DRAFT_71215 [Amanita muscaria Koide BX008]